MNDYSEYIRRLYTAVLEKHKTEFKVNENAIKDGIRNLGIAYAPNQWQREHETLVDYNNAGNRCAYLFKYAMLHTGLVYDVLKQALNMYGVKQSMDYEDQVNLCSLGSGPGSDIVGFLLALTDRFGPKRCNATLIDCSIQWKCVFDTVVSEMNRIASNEISSKEYFTYEYFCCNLLEFPDGRIRDSIKKADVITMIKFVSAAACKDTHKMIEKICFNMKPGAILLYIDNAAGGFYEMMDNITKLYGLISLYGVIKHYVYEEPLFNIQRSGHISQYKTKVTIEIWKKMEIQPQNTTMQLQQEFFRNGSFSNEINIPIDNQSYDEIDSIHPQIRLQIEKDTEIEKESSCCIIM